MSGLLDIEGLSVAYGPVSALQNVTLTVGVGEAVALVGANGAGKSTLFKSIVGFLRPRSGQLLFRGRDMSGVRPERRARQRPFTHGGGAHGPLRLHLRRRRLDPAQEA